MSTLEHRTPRLADFANGRDNNFNLIRMVAAMAVLVSHSFALAIGSGDAEPLRAWLGVTPGSMAVDVFFVTSGFLVTASLQKSESLVDFAWARVLRIYPALIVMLLLTVFGLGLALSTWPSAAYLTAHETWVYLARCATLVTGVSFHLPGVFEGNPYPRAVNGSLWTMPIEIRMYFILAVTWAVAGVASRIVRVSGSQLFRAAILTLTAAAAMTLLVLQLRGGAEQLFLRLLFVFFAGASMCILRTKVILSRPAFWMLLVLTLLAAFTSQAAFLIVYTFGVAYLVLYCAYVPAGKVRSYNRIGDYSYGIYIYAFPVQQTVAASVPGITVAAMMLVSAAVTPALAALSWHLLEQRALGLKRHLVGRTRRG